MKYLILFSIFVLTLILFFFNTKSAWACQYGSTQARVQLNGEQFNVGGFHDTTGHFANDTTILISGPGMNRTAFNGETIRNLQAGGTYSVNVITNNQTGGGCTETATVIINSSAKIRIPKRWFMLNRVLIHKERGIIDSEC